MKKRIKEIVFSMVVVMLLTVIGLQYELSLKEEVSYAKLHSIPSEVLEDSKKCSVMRDSLINSLVYTDNLLEGCAADNDSVKYNYNALAKRYNEIYAYSGEVDAAHKRLWEQYFALQADYNAYMDYINSGEDKQKLLAGIKACAADNDSIKHNYDKLAMTYTQLYEYSDSIYTYSNAVYRDYHKLDSAYNVLYKEYETMYYEYVAGEEESEDIVGL